MMGGILKQSGKENAGAVVDDGGGLMAELDSEQALKRERLMKNYKKWKIVIISVICFVLLFIMAFLLTMFICIGGLLNIHLHKDMISTVDTLLYFLFHYLYLVLGSIDG
jgi:hypothetical protein